MNLYLADFLILLILIAAMLIVSLVRAITDSGQRAARVSPAVAPEPVDEPEGDYYATEPALIGDEISERAELSRRVWEMAANDDLMAVADAAPPHVQDFELWEEQCYSLVPLADRVNRIGEKHR